VVEADIYDLFDVDFACVSGQETAAAVPVFLIDVCFADHDYASFPAEDSNVTFMSMEVLASCKKSTSR